jgi:hypothetical protein
LKYNCCGAKFKDEEKAKTQEKKSKSAWSAAEDDALLKAVVEDQQDREAEGNGDDDEDWDEIAESVPNKTPVQCLKRYMSLNKKLESKGQDSAGSSGEEQPESPDKKPQAKKQKRDTDSSKWTTEEVELLKKLVEQYKDSK